MQIKYLHTPVLSSCFSTAHAISAVTGSTLLPDPLLTSQIPAREAPLPEASSKAPSTPQARDPPKARTQLATDVHVKTPATFQVQPLSPITQQKRTQNHTFRCWPHGLRPSVTEAVPFPPRPTGISGGC